MEKLKYHTILSNYFVEQPLFFDGDLQKKPHIRKCAELPVQQTKAELWDEVTDSLCNLDFIQAKACAKMTYDLVRDFNAVLEAIPDNAENIKHEKARQARMEKYTRDLIACAKGEIKIDELQIPESITPWSQEKIDIEIERIKSNPTRFEVITDFANFLGQESSTMQEWACEFPDYTIQLAWNYAREGPVSKAVEKCENYKSRYLLLNANVSRLEWNPLPLKLKILRGCKLVPEAFKLTQDKKFAIANNLEDCLIWDVKTGQIKCRMIGQEKFVSFVSLTADYKRAFSVSRNKAFAVNKHFDQVYSRTLNIWNAETGQLVDKLQDFNSFWALDISPDGRYVFSATYNNSCLLLDIERKQILLKLIGHKGPVLAVSMTPDCRLGLSASADCTCILWDLMSGQIIRSFVGHKNSVTSISITPDGKYGISGSQDKTCILWDLMKGQILQTLYGHNDSILAVNLTPDKMLGVSGSSDGIFIFWNLDEGKILKKIAFSSTDDLNQLSISVDGRFSLLPFSGVCALINLENGRLFEKNPVNTQGFRTINTTPDGRIAISHHSNSNSIIWNLENLKIIRKISEKDDLKSVYLGNEFSINSISLNRKWGIQVKDNTYIRGDLVDNQIFINILDSLFQNINPQIISPDGKCAIIDNELCNIITGVKIKTLSKDFITAVGMSPSGKEFILGFNDGTCTLGRLATGEVLERIDWNLHWKRFEWLPAAKAPGVKYLIFCPDNRKIISLSSDYHHCIIWDLTTKKIIAQYSSDNFIDAVALLPGGLVLGIQKGELIKLNGTKELLCTGPGILTIKKIWDFKTKGYQKPIADCPLCGDRFMPLKTIFETIRNITRKADLRPDQSPCLDLADEAWEDPGLLGNCPKCGAALKFNPFIAGGDN